jgi:hypothetical protein
MHKTTVSVRYFAGLDLGQSQDFTALAVLERTAEADEDGCGRPPFSYAVRHLERFPPGTPFTEVGARSAALLAEPPLRHATLVVDQTGVGAPVLELLRQSGLRAGLRPVTVTSGHAAQPDGRGGWLVPKAVLVSTLQVLLQSRRLRVAGSLAEAETLAKELANFRAKVTTLAAGDPLAAWREGAHDDLVLAIAIAAWEGERYRPLRIWV